MRDTSAASASCAAFRASSAFFVGLLSSHLSPTSHFQMGSSRLSIEHFAQDNQLCCNDRVFAFKGAMVVILARCNRQSEPSPRLHCNVRGSREEEGPAILFLAVLPWTASVNDTGVVTNLY